MKTQLKIKNVKLKNRPVGGGKAGGDGTKAKSGKRKAETVSERRKLVGILEEFGVSVAGFDGLRRDAYEKHLAGRSLAKLEEFYGRLLNPSEGCEKIREGCLPWGEDSGYKDKLPSVRTLSEIKERILTERRLAEMAPRLKALAQIAGSLTGLPVAERVVVLQGMQALIASELMGLVGQGQRVLDHLPAVDRVIRAVSAQARVEQGAERNRLQEKALELRKAESEKRKAEIRNRRARGNPQQDDYDNTEPYDVEAEKEKVRRMTERIYGKNPNKLKEEAKANETGANVTLDPNHKTNDECKMTNGEGTKTVATANDTKNANETSVTLDPNEKKNDECKMTNGASVATEVVETIEEYQRRQREAEEHRRWVERQMRIRDKVNGTEFSFNPYA